MIMKGYSVTGVDENCAMAKAENINASFKDLAEVCGRIRGKKAEWALGFLERVADGKAAVLYRSHNRKLGHRRELGGKQGRYPKKAAKAVLKVLNSAIANGRVKGLGEEYNIIHATANKKMGYGRVAPKGRWSRSDYETSRIEIILKSVSEVPKGVEVTPPKKEPEKKVEPKKEEKKEAPKAEEKPKEEPKKEEKKPEKKEGAPKEEKKEEPKKEEKAEEPKKSDVKKEVHE
jgi:large subunit ribosomal protein L22